LGAYGAVGADQVPQLFLADVLALAVGVATHEAHGQIGRVRQQPHRRTGDRRQHCEGPGRDQAPALGPLHGHPLGGQLAEDERDVGQQQGDHHDCDRPGSLAEEPEWTLQRLGQ
jgi:hypothetical protein